MAAESSMTTGWIRLGQELAISEGFDRCGVAAVPEPGSFEDYVELGMLEAWVESGHAGEMEYLKRRDAQGALLRSSLRVALPWARSVLVCALNYNNEAPHSLEEFSPDAGWIARYAMGGCNAEHGVSQPSDYHHVLMEKLRYVESGLRERLRVEFESRCYVDTGPVIERVYAKYAGIGWVGKNTCILDQKLGSWMFLGVIVTSLPVLSGVSVEIAPDRCGSCTRCIDACPTQAITAPHQLDASRCIAYLTIEKKGSIDEELRPAMGRHVFGCDICQEVCPWNNPPRSRKFALTTTPELQAREELVNPALEWLASLDNAGFKRVFKSSPVERTGLKRLKRNAAIAMGNSGERKFLPRLLEWADGTDPVLAEAAVWAAKRIEIRGGHRSGPTPREAGAFSEPRRSQGPRTLC